MTQPSTQTNILIVRMSALGDVVHTLPAVELLRRHFPGCFIAWLVEKKAANLLQGYPGIDRLIVSNRVKWTRDLQALRVGHVAVGMRSFILELRSVRYDIIIDFQGLLKSALPVWLARGKRKIGYDNAREGSRLFYTEKVVPACFDDHAIKRHLGLIQYLGAKGSPVLFHRLFSHEDEESVDSLFDRIKLLRSKPIVLFHLSAAWPTKLWMHEKAGKLCSMLQKKFDCQMLLTGSDEEQTYLDKIRSVAGEEVTSLAGKTTLRELVCIISRSALMISVDSGPMHLSCAVNTPVVALFGPTAPWRTGPFGENNTVIRKEISCSPCYCRKRCPEGHHRCMKDIEVEDVFKVCCNYLKL